MLPISLNLEKLSIALIGQGKQFERRKKILEEQGAKKLSIISPQPSTKIDFNQFDIVLIVDAKNDEELYKQAKAAKCLVNVEDKKQYCDFYFQTFIQRGDLQISVSTNGKSPGTARLIREKLEKDFGEEWGNRIEEIASKRSEWKKQGDSFDEVNKKTEEYINSQKWLN